MSITTKSLMITLVAGLVIAAPPVPVEESLNLGKRQGTIPSCYTSDEYSNLKQEDPYYTKPERVSGYQCESLKESKCSLGKEVSHSVEVSKSVSGSLTGGLDLGKISGLGADAGFSYTWSTSDAKSVSEESECPPGGMVCGLSVEAKVVKVKGHKKTTYLGGCDRVDEGDFEITAPVTTKGANKDQAAVQTFHICLAEDCKDDDCKKAAEKEGIKKCP